MPAGSGGNRMVILGLLLLAAAVVAGVELVVSNLGAVGFEVFGTSMTADLATVFLLGAITMAVATLGTFLITGAFQRRRGHRYEAKHRQTEERLGEYDRTTAELVEENDRLRGELAEERRAAATLGGVAVPPGVGDVAYGDQITDAARSEAISDTGRFDPYPTTPPVSPVSEVRPQTIDNTKFDDDHLRVGANGDSRATGEEKAGVLGRFRGDNR
jgi:membrane protein implicated in regulation of membrane protease activity